MVGRADEAGLPEEVMRMPAHESQADEVNEVTLVGRLSDAAEEQVLPSGAELWKFRVIVGRPASHASRVSVDALDCVVWAKRPARGSSAPRSTRSSPRTDHNRSRRPRRSTPRRVSGR